MLKNRFLLVAFALFAWLSATAQTSSINTFSPYSMYGVGEIGSQGSLAQRSMGGVGVAQRSMSGVNTLNPAAYSITLQKSILFNFGLEGQNYYNSQLKGDGSHAMTSYNTFNIRDIALQIPLTKGLGLGFNLNPYSSVGYRIFKRSEPIADVGVVDYDYTGEGDVTLVKAGLGWEIFKNFSLGVAAQYYWGDIDRKYVATIYPYTGTGSYPGLEGNTKYSISNVKAQVGVQYTPILDRKRVLTIGATYDMGGDLNPTITNNMATNGILTSTIKADTMNLAIKLPHKLTVGVFYETNKFAVGFDYVYQNWGSNNSFVENTAGAFDVRYCNTNTVKFGVEWTPNRNDVRNFLRRWHYRAGFNYGNYHQEFGGERVREYAVTFGFGIPVKFGGFSSIDVGVEYGCRGEHAMIKESVGMIKQQYFKFAVSFALFGEDYWFVRPKFD